MKRKPAAAYNVDIDLDPTALGEFECAYPVQRFNGCARQLPTEYESRGAERIYRDPPYLQRSRTSGRRYRFDRLEQDHIELPALLKTSPCHVILSGYPSMQSVGCYTVDDFGSTLC